MKRNTLTILSALSLFCCASALANPQIAKANRCFECHSIDKGIIGPSIRQIADKYKNQVGAQSQLADKVRKGSIGVWGTTPMQAYPDMPKQDIDAVIEWMLNR
jgi:cytochrome c